MSDNYQQPYNQQPTPYQQPDPYQQPGGYPPQQYPSAPSWPHMRLGEWMITMLLMIIPIVNIVLMFVWAFGGNVNPSKKTYFQAALIWAAIGIVLSIILGTVFAALIASVFGGIF